MTYHLPVLAGHCNVHPHLASCRLLMEEPNMGMDSEIRTFEKATNLLHLTTSGLAPSTMVVHPYEHLTAFKDTRGVITVKNIERILISISMAMDMEMLEMQHFRMMVVDAVTVPTLERLFVEPGFVSWTDFTDTDLEPDTLFLVLSLLLRSQCQSTLREIGFRNVRLTAHIIDVLQLCPALDKIQFTFQYWQKFLDADFGALLRELRWTNADRSLACAPTLMLVMLRIGYSRIPTILSFF
ncbi:hypothetical protein ARMSODRAFT_983555 [Armillaria solidipes]|uniref:F-box domain-containing protein n=1 Tax=Armillaria solidipes TaxID=1076256 RepID=A0A2H3AIT5_9AGAR|nr:hypothetical protein ARMSODRAFT_983555 [Armillaria solidipes]